MTFHSSDKHSDFKSALREKALSLGFRDVRVCAAEIPETDKSAYKEWIARGLHGEMEYMARTEDLRLNDINSVLPGTKSVIVFAASYYSKNQSADENSHEEPNGKIARYALGRDYHNVFREKLAVIIEWLNNEMPGEQWRACSDSAPLLERSYARRSGIGFLGKNTMIISWMAGSFTLLAEILTTAEITPDEERFGTCGNCTRCIDACPTAALEPYRLNATRCISYLTIEKKSLLTDEEISATGDWIFGCDICQEVCPYNKNPEEGIIVDLISPSELTHIYPMEKFLVPQSNGQFEKMYPESPVLRPGKKRMQNLITEKLKRIKKS